MVKPMAGIMEEMAGKKWGEVEVPRPNGYTAPLPDPRLTAEIEQMRAEIKVLRQELSAAKAGANEWHERWQQREADYRTQAKVAIVASFTAGISLVTALSALFGG